VLCDLNRDLGLTTVVVTHDPAVGELMDRSVAIRDGRTSTEVLHGEAAEETIIIDSVGRLQIPRPLLEALPFAGRARVHLSEDHIELYPAVSGSNGEAPDELLAKGGAADAEPPSASAGDAGD
jgi:hypothetical protein